METSQLHVVILAAGSSRRLGQPKQLLVVEEQTLLGRVYQTVRVHFPASQVHVVLGAQAGLMREQLPAEALTVENTEHQEGMASSIRAGVGQLPVEAEGVLLLTCDQPLLSAALIGQIVETAQRRGRGIVACGYANQLGIPMLFDRRYFVTLLSLRGDKGAKTFLPNYLHDVAVVPFAEGALDIDTPTDWENFRERQANKCPKG
jgi:molybdenum cofactor cytidylyltransferase